MPSEFDINIKESRRVSVHTNLKASPLSGARALTIPNFRPLRYQLSTSGGFTTAQTVHVVQMTVINGIFLPGPPTKYTVNAVAHLFY